MHDTWILMAPMKQMALEIRCTSWYPGSHSFIRCTLVKGSSCARYAKIL